MTPAPIWPSVNSAATPSAIVTTVERNQRRMGKEPGRTSRPGDRQTEKSEPNDVVSAAIRSFVMARSFAR